MPVRVSLPITATSASASRGRGPRSVVVSALLAAVAGALLTIGGCQADTSDRDVSLVGVGAARAVVGTSRGRLGGTRTGAWIDPRLRVDWLAERIPGSINAPIATLRDRSRDLAAYDFLVVYGDRYKDPVAMAAAKTLAELGIAEVRMLQGGLGAWVEAGNATASGTPGPDEKPPVPPAR